MVIENQSQNVLIIKFYPSNDGVACYFKITYILNDSLHHTNKWQGFSSTMSVFSKIDVDFEHLKADNHPEFQSRQKKTNKN
jgi:hypothetical protein